MNGNNPHGTEEPNWGVQMTPELEKVVQDAEVNPYDAIDKASRGEVFAFKAEDLKKLKAAIRHGDTVGALAKLRSSCIRMPNTIMGARVNEVIQDLQNQG